MGQNQFQRWLKKQSFKNLDIITSNVDLSGLEVETAE